MMGGTFSTEDNDELVDKLVYCQYIKTPSVEKVFRMVDRGFYFLPTSISYAYYDTAWKHGNIHISAPCIYSEVMESLQLQPGHSFLNLGSGTGYLSTLAGLLIGPHGINHGIELYKDVIDYAYSKLKEFKEKCSAIDSFEFAEPVFVHGNGFSINRIRQYDRVYCGAACPETHLDFVKDLLKINGILVVPCNEELLKITRISETDWERKFILPVSFSMLRLPDKEVKIDLPDSIPLPLTDICRACIRKSLREIVDKENPDVQKVPIRINPDRPILCSRFPFRAVCQSAAMLSLFCTEDSNSDNDNPSFNDNSSLNSTGTSFSSDSEYSSGTNNSQMSDEEEQKMMDDAGNDREMPDKKRNRERRNQTSPYCRKKKVRRARSPSEANATERKVRATTNRRSKKFKNRDSPSRYRMSSTEEVIHVSCSSKKPTGLSKTGKKFKNNGAADAKSTANDNNNYAAYSDANNEDDDSGTSGANYKKDRVKKQSGKIVKREKLDSGFGDESTVERSSVESKDTSSESNSSTEVNGSEDSNFVGTSGSSVNSSPCSICDVRIERATKDDRSTKTAENDGRPKITYRVAIQEKIKLLPLPSALKLYLNYYREINDN